MCQQVGDADDFLIFSVFAHPGLKFRYVEADGIQETELPRSARIWVQMAVDMDLLHEAISKIVFTVIGSVLGTHACCRML